MNGHLIDARHLNLIDLDTDLDGWPGVCYADCPLWHGCDCPAFFNL